MLYSLCDIGLTYHLVVPVMYRLINPVDRWLRKFYEVDKIK